MQTNTILTNSYIAPELLLHSLRTLPERKQFQHIFNNSFPELIAAIRSSGYRLTSGEMLLCSLILMRYPSSELSLKMGISQSSVNTLRYRLRKKFKLRPHQSLNDFIYNSIKPSLNP